MHMVYNRDLSQRLFFAAVAIFSFTGNLFFIVLIVRNRKLMKNAYHVILLSLAITDMMTGMFLLLTPVYIIGEQPALAGENFGSAIFCYIVANQFLVFTFGIVSLYTVTLLAVERWFAVFRPLRYRTAFRPHRVQKYLITVWIISFVANSTHIIETKYFLHSGNTTKRCVFNNRFAGNEARAAIGVVEICIKFLIPAGILLITFTRLYHFMKGSAVLTTTRRSSYVALTRVTHMAAITALVMVLCWFPNQLFYLLFKLNVVQLNTPWHRVTVILCMFNSCLNPCIFLLSNKIYRKKAKELLPSCSEILKKDEISLKEPKRVTQSAVCVKFTKGNSLEGDKVQIFQHALNSSLAMHSHDLG
ncbi:galanin receptor 2a-like isoform X3 [Oculina patagonica]